MKVVRERPAKRICCGAAHIDEGAAVLAHPLQQVLAQFAPGRLVRLHDTADLYVLHLYPSAAGLWDEGALLYVGRKFLDRAYLQAVERGPGRDRGAWLRQLEELRAPAVVLHDLRHGARIAHGGPLLAVGAPGDEDSLVHNLRLWAAREHPAVEVRGGVYAQWQAGPSVADMELMLRNSADSDGPCFYCDARICGRGPNPHAACQQAHRAEACPHGGWAANAHLRLRELEAGRAAAEARALQVEEREAGRLRATEAEARRVAEVAVVPPVVAAVRQDAERRRQQEADRQEAERQQQEAAEQRAAAARAERAAVLGRAADFLAPRPFPDPRLSRTMLEGMLREGQLVARVGWPAAGGGAQCDVVLLKGLAALVGATKYRAQREPAAPRKRGEGGPTAEPAGQRDDRAGNRWAEHTVPHHGPARWHEPALQRRKTAKGGGPWVALLSHVLDAYCEPA